MNRYKKARAAYNALVRHRIRVLMAVELVKVPELAAKTGLTRSTVQMVLSQPKVNPRLSHIARMAEALHFDLGALLGTRVGFARALGRKLLKF